MERKPFIFCNDDFGQEIMAKVNALFDGTLAAIPLSVRDQN